MNSSRPVLATPLLLTASDGLRGTHPLYNEAINASMNEQFVQNLVRLHYRDPTYFLDVANVAATLKLNLSDSLNQSAFGFNGTTGNDIMKFSAGADYQTQPTISEAPLQGENFFKSVLSPLPLESVFAVAGSGRNARRVFGLCVDRINGLENAPTASGPTLEIGPQHDEGFRRLMHLVEVLRGESLLVPRVDPATQLPQLQIRSTPRYAATIARSSNCSGWIRSVNCH